MAGKNQSFTRGDLIDKICSKEKVTKKVAQNVVDAFLSAMKETLQDGVNVELRGFGTFALRVRPARTGHNPQTGATINIAEKSVVTFKPGKDIQDSVKNVKPKLKK